MKDECETPDPKIKSSDSDNQMEAIWCSPKQTSTGMLF